MHCNQQKHNWLGAIFFRVGIYMHSDIDKTSESVLMVIAWNSIVLALEI